MPQTGEITVSDFFKGIHPNWNISSWITWPPDVFALTSLLLERTGGYIFTVSPPQPWPDILNWHENLQVQSEDWHKWLLGLSKSKPGLLKECIDTIRRYASEITIENIVELVSINGEPKPAAGMDQDKTWELCKAIITLHVLADEACAGLGIPGVNSPQKYLGKSETELASDKKALFTLANMLLTHTGSLSLLPVNQVRVLPKLAKPSSGLTLRSVSHYVTAHQTEVDILWRTMPWSNLDENTINILIVPWPDKFEANWFQPSGYITKRKSAESVRYFNYLGPRDMDFSPDMLLSLIASAGKSVNRIHMIVFPELALTEKNLKTLLKALDQLPRDMIPMVLTGVRSEQVNPQELGQNSIVLSTYFAGKWYQMKQNKHHRWKLDERQIQQYNLGAVLAGNRDWWEAINISRRQLSVLAPNNWLTLCPLICEDLARLEPVSEIIRGIGPTLLIALLLDGPQLQGRWPGRYASVLADDPGTSVLTVSALGLTERSIPPKNVDGNQTSRKIALWKDPLHGWEDIDLAQGANAVVLTATAHWIEKNSADGRSDNKTSASFVFQGVHQISIEKTPSKRGNSPLLRKNQSVKNGNDDKRFAKEWDLSELSLFSYYVDGILDSNNNNIKPMHDWVLAKNRGTLSRIRPKARLLDKIREKVKETIDNPANQDDLKPYLEWLVSFINNVQDPASNEDFPDRFDRAYEGLVDDIEKILDVVNQKGFRKKLLNGGNPFARQQKYGIKLKVPLPPRSRDTLFKDQQVRIYIYGCLSILWAIHMRLSELRRRHLLNDQGTRYLMKIEGLLHKKYDQRWY